MQLLKYRIRKENTFFSTIVACLSHILFVIYSFCQLSFDRGVHFQKIQISEEKKAIFVEAPRAEQ